jgi:hypothetical protein
VIQAPGIVVQPGVLLQDPHTQGRVAGHRPLGVVFHARSSGTGFAMIAMYDVETAIRD